MLDLTLEMAERLRPFFRYAQVVALMFVLGALLAIAQVWQALRGSERWIADDGLPVAPDSLRYSLGWLTCVAILGLLVFILCRRMSRRIADLLANS
jgi:ABC-type Fe3+ transport system permease subunit